MPHGHMHMDFAMMQASGRSACKMKYKNNVHTGAHRSHHKMVQEPVSRRLWAIGGHADYRGSRGDQVQELPFITTKKLTDLALEYVSKNLDLLGPGIEDIPLELRHRLQPNLRLPQCLGKK